MEPENLTPSSVDAAELEERGFTADFFLEDGAVVDRGSGARFVPEEVAIVEEHRYEGPTDPADESVLLALEAPDGTRGTLAVHYGANTEHADEIRRLGTAKG